MITDTSSDSEEEILLFAEFEDSINIDHFRNIHVLGIDTKNPVIQLDDAFVTGKYELPLGTYMFFEEDNAAKTEDPLFDKLPDKNLKFLCKTNKYLYMQCAQALPKKETDAGEKTVKIMNELEQPSFSNAQEAIERFRQTWKPMDDPQIDISKLSDPGENNKSECNVSNNNL